MLYVHEVHHVIGRREDEFEDLLRDTWLPALAKSDGARLLWCCRHVHGTGPAYQLITLTAVRDGASWQQLAARVQSGDLREVAARLDECRHGLESKVLLPVPWSPLQDVDFGDVPDAGQDAARAPVLFLEDTGWPSAPLDAYTGFWGESYHAPMQARPSADRLLEVVAAFQPAYGSGRRKEAILWQRILDHDKLLALLTQETDPERKKPGTFMAEALGYRDEWESRLLRTVPWSPLR